MVSYVKTTKNKLNTVPLRDGQIIVTTDESSFGGGGGSAHTIVDASGTSLEDRDNLKFVGATTTDDSENDTTVVTIPTTTFNGRSGSIVPVAGDYDATQVNYSSQQTIKQKIDALKERHSVLDNTGTAVTDRASVQFSGRLNATDDSTNQKTVVSVSDEFIQTTPVSCLTGDSGVTIQNANIHTTSIIKDVYTQSASGTVVAISKIEVTEGQAVVTFAKALTEAVTAILLIKN